MALLRVAGVRAAHRDRYHGSVDADSTIEHSYLQALGASFSAASAGAAAVASTVLEAFVRWRSSSLIHPLGSRPASVSRASVDRARVSRARMHRARVLSARAPSVWTQRAAKRAWPSVHGRGRGSTGRGQVPCGLRRDSWRAHRACGQNEQGQRVIRARCSACACSSLVVWLTRVMCQPSVCRVLSLGPRC